MSETHTHDAQKIVKHYTLGSLAPGAIPFPLIDLLLVSGLQLKMLHALAQHYGVPFKKEAGRAAISALLGGIGALGVSRVAGSGLKAIPVIGPVMGGVGLAAVSAATTYAIGQVFVQHFESGGTFLTFDAGQVKEYFTEQYLAARKLGTGEKPPQS